MRVLVIDNYDSLHLQPRPVPGRARGRARGRAQRPRRRSTSCSSAAPTASSSRPGPCTPTEAGISVEAIRALPRGRHARRSASASATSRWSRRSAAGRPRRARPRQGRRDRARRPGDLRGPARPAGRRPLPLARRRPGAARRLELTASLRRRRDGRPPPRAAGRGRPVPSRVGAHPDRASSCWRTSSARAHGLDAQRRPHPRDRRALRRRRPDRRPGRRRCSPRSWRATPRRCRPRAFLIALRTKGETVDELVGLARTMRSLATPVPTRAATTCSTPPARAAGRPTFNVSTTAALIAAGAGCAVAKHGNRSATSRAGSADVLEALGVRIDLTPEQVADAASTRSASASCSRPAPPGDALRRPGAQGARGADDLQLPRPADQPGRREAAAPRRLGPRRSRRRSPRPCSPRLRPRAGRLGRRRTGRAQHRRAGPAWSRSRMAARTSGSSRPEDLGLGIAPLETIAGGDPDAERRRHPVDPRRASRAPSAMSPCSTPARRSTSAELPSNLGDGVEQARRGGRLRRRCGCPCPPDRSLARARRRELRSSGTRCA